MPMTVRYAVAADHKVNAFKAKEIPQLTANSICAQQSSGLCGATSSISCHGLIIAVWCGRPRV